jgi:hypothetical protein
LDGLFNEWSQAATIIDDAPDAGDASVDFLSLQGLDDPRWLYLALDVGNEVTLQSLPGTIHLLVDADADAGTGGALFDVEGVDLVVDFSQTAEAPNDGRGLGFAMRSVRAGGETLPLERHALELAALPTSSAPRFEIRLSRRGAPGIAPFGTRIRLAAVYSEAGRALDETTVGSYAFTTRLGESSGRATGSRMEKAPGSLRVAQWNVNWANFPRSAEGFARVLGALDPDVILLDELPGDVRAGQIPGIASDQSALTAAELRDFFSREPLASLGSWRFVLGEGGGYQRTLVAARGRDIRAAEPMTNVRHPPGAFGGLLATAPELTPFLLGEIESGLPAAGAWVEVAGQEVLFVAVDLQSRGWLGSPRDLQRLRQATTIHDHIRRTLGAGRAPVVIGGDLNLVGSRTPLFTLARGLDVDGSDLVPVQAERLGERSITTWRSPRDVFAPGRLDYVLISDAGIMVTNSFVFTTEDLDDATLDRLGLTHDLSLALSDHLVTVVDLRLR